MSPKFTQLQLAYLKTFQPQPAETMKGGIFGASFFHHLQKLFSHIDLLLNVVGHEFFPYYSEISWTFLLEFSKTVVNTK